MRVGKLSLRLQGFCRDQGTLNPKPCTRVLGLGVSRAKVRSLWHTRTLEILEQVLLQYPV